MGDAAKIEKLEEQIDALEKLFCGFVRVYYTDQMQNVRVDETAHKLRELMELVTVIERRSPGER